MNACVLTLDEVCSESLVLNLRLKRVNSEKLLQDYGKRACKLQGQRLSLEDFGQFLELPVSGELRHLFALFDEVN